MPLPVGSRGVTTGSPADPLDPLDAEDLRDRVHKALDDLIARQSDVLDGVSDELAPLMDSIGDLLRGGKRLRPAFCYWGWRGAGGDDTSGIVTVADPDAAHSSSASRSCVRPRATRSWTSRAPSDSPAAEL